MWPSVEHRNLLMEKFPKTTVFISFVGLEFLENEYEKNTF